MAPGTPGSRSVNGGTGGLDVGDVVDVPGGMHGIVKFIGNVTGKNGIFAGVELSREYAQRGKNDGDVDGVRYFTTSVPRSGIFLPIARASKRVSPTPRSDSLPLSPSSPSIAGINPSGPPGQQSMAQRDYSPPTPSIPNLSQSVGPGRATSPIFKPKSRPSLPRPESPVRRQQNLLGTPAGRPSLGGLTTPRPLTTRYAPSPTPGKFASAVKPKRNSNSYSADPGKRFGVTATPEPKVTGGRRAQSAMGNRLSREVDSEAGRIGVARTSNSSQHSTALAGIKSRETIAHDEGEIASLKAKLEERDRQLKEQAASLAEMESSLAELQTLIPSSRPEGPTRSKSSNAPEEADITQLRALLREKNEKIAMLTGEFDAHRADFRSTIDTLELASTETERVYEKRVQELLQEIRELQERSEDVESVALQLKQLEELVQELEDGLEDARRGEAEARGEVEFLRGEVERGRSELRREREKAAAALQGAGAAVNGGGIDGAKEVEQRDDEIRGLKAIIHSLSRDSVPAPDFNHNGQVNGQATNRRLSQQVNEERAAREHLEREVQELRGLVERKAYRVNELERELEESRKDHPGTTVKHPLNTTSEDQTEEMNRKEFPAGSRTNEMFPTIHGNDHESEQYSIDEIDDDIPLPWCPVCEKEGHDITTCSNIDNNNNPTAEATSSSSQQHQEEEEHTITITNPRSSFPPASSFSLGLQRRTGRDVVLQGLKRLSTPRTHIEEDDLDDLDDDDVHDRRANANNNNSNNQRNSSTQITITPPPPPATTAPEAKPPPSPAQQQQIDDNDDKFSRLPDPLDRSMIAGKGSGIIDEDKWCALCEKDGHESVDCPYDEAFQRLL